MKTLRNILLTEEFFKEFVEGLSGFEKKFWARLSEMHSTSCKKNVLVIDEFIEIFVVCAQTLSENVLGVFSEPIKRVERQTFGRKRG